MLLQVEQQVPGLIFSVEFRRNFGIFFVFAIHREKKIQFFSVYFVSKFKNSKKIVKKYVKNMIKTRCFFERVALEIIQI